MYFSETLGQFLFYYSIFVIIWTITIIIHEFGHFVPAYLMGFTPKFNIISLNHFQVEYHSDNLRLIQRMIITTTGIVSGFVVLLSLPIVFIIYDNILLSIFSISIFIGYFWCARGDIKSLISNIETFTQYGNILMEDDKA